MEIQAIGARAIGDGSGLGQAMRLDAAIRVAPR